MLYDVLIIGSGPAGLTCAIYLARANKNVVLLTGLEKGGQLMKTTHVANYPGFEKTILGPDLMNAMAKQATNYANVHEINDDLVELNKEKKTFYAKTLVGQEIAAKCVVVATGSKPKMLGIEKEFIGKGISTCATCDGNFFRQKTVAVIGGGNTAFEEALYLSDIVKKVYLIHRRNEFRAEAMLQENVKQKSNVEFLTPYNVINFSGRKKLEFMLIKNAEDNSAKNIELDGAFISIGHIPNTDLFKKFLELDEMGYVKKGVKTEFPGLFVCGDVFDYKYRQAVTAAGFGCMASFEALHYLNQKQSSC